MNMLRVDITHVWGFTYTGENSILVHFKESYDSRLEWTIYSVPISEIFYTSQQSTSI